LKRSCFILGCSRSGTSLTAGLLAQAGYFMGDRLFPADEGNPKGYFEDHEVNGINEGLLAQLLPGPRRTLTDKLFRRRPHPRAQWFRWLAELRTDQVVPCPDKFAERIKAQVSRQPFCFKDPRFCYTLGAWRQFAPDSAILCVFRHPDASAASIVKEAQRGGVLLDGVPVDDERALRIWRMMYSYVLDVHFPAGGDWLFIHYEQLITGRAYPAIERLLEVKVDRTFADANLRRSTAPMAVRTDVAELYHRLCERAGFRPG
jgi:hypothetical protein